MSVRAAREYAYAPSLADVRDGPFKDSRSVARPCQLKPVIAKSLIFVLAYACAAIAVTIPFALSAQADGASNWQRLSDLLLSAASLGAKVAPYIMPGFLLVACLERSLRAFIIAGLGGALVCSAWMFFIVEEMPQGQALLGCFAYAVLGTLGGLVFGVVYQGLAITLED